MSPTGLNIKTKLADMEIGDCIPCKYLASISGSLGTFSELGTCTESEIPTDGVATPNGLFYFIKVDKGLLIADRVIQHSITWNTLNNGKYIEGSLLDIGSSEFIPAMIRSLSGGVAFSDGKGNKSLTDKGYGAWPVDNEWDKYIVKSDLRGKITPGDNNIWHWNLGSWVRESGAIGVLSNNGNGASSGYMAYRGLSNYGLKGYAYAPFNTVYTVLGFRPVLEYIEPDGSSNQTTLWY